MYPADIPPVYQSKCYERFHFFDHPLGIFSIHLVLVYSFVFLQQEEWLGYAVITSIMASSLSNQYLRIGSFACNEGCEL